MYDIWFIWPHNFFCFLWGIDKFSLTRRLRGNASCFARNCRIMICTSSRELMYKTYNCVSYIVSFKVTCKCKEVAKNQSKSLHELSPRFRNNHSNNSSRKIKLKIATRVSKNVGNTVLWKKAFVCMKIDKNYATVKTGIKMSWYCLKL